MTTYKGIQGRSVQKLSSDPGTLEDVVGQLWYNTGTGTFKLATENAVSAGTWAASANINTARYYMDGAGSATASIIAAGTPNYYKCETFDGSTWTEENQTLSQKGYNGLCGIQTAALCVGASTPSPTQTELWDGTCWSEVNALNTGRGNKGPCAGPTSAAIVAGGSSAAGATELWNGTVWTETGHAQVSPAAPTQGRGGWGTQTAMMAVGGEPAYTDSETYNGSTWTEGNEINTGRGNTGGSGTVTAAILMCGGPYPVGNYSETYDGTSWTAGPVTAQAHGFGCGNGDIGSSQASTFVAGGYAPGAQNNSDIWTYTQFVSKTVTVS